MTACKECGTAVPDEKRFCPACGSAVGAQEQYLSGAESPENHVADASGFAYVPASPLPPVSFKEVQPEAPSPHELNPSQPGTPPPTYSAPPAYTSPPANTPPPAYTSPPANTPPPASTPPPAYSQPPPGYTKPPVQTGYARDDPPPYGSPYSVMGTGSYIGLMILFRIPVIGFIACLIVSFAARNRNMRNFARAELVLAIISILLLVAVILIIGWFWGVIVENIENYFRNAVYSSIYNSIPELSGVIPDLDGTFPELDGAFPEYGGAFPGFDGTLPDNVSLSDLLDILAGLGLPGYQTP